MNEKRERRRAIFADCYRSNGWGYSSDGRPYYSDSPGSLTAPIRKVISSFIREKSIQSVVDLGCGDFELASGIDMHQASYVGLDIFDDLIAWNTDHFGDSNRQFRVADIVEDELPDGDLCMIYTVLYILSEEEVFRVLEKLRKYRFVLITDGQPDIPKEARRNIDKKTDKYTRQDYYNNGFYLELAPYNLDLEILIEHKLLSGEIMRTVLLDQTK